MSDAANFPVLVQRTSRTAGGVISLARPADRATPPTIRATAMVFEDPVSLAVKASLDRLAPSDAGLLIIGETGTGKELAARYVHEHSPRRDGPFLAVNCGALVETLVEAELFGYEKGAFTGAIRTQVGWFEAANGGTLLLDEIGDLPLALQVKLLRVLQEKEVVRLGARNAIPVDVRVIAATNVDLIDAVSSGRFRQDLYFRLNVASVALPSLRDRRADIRHLAEHFLVLYREKLGRPELRFGDAALDVLNAYAWPGNIRELENVVHNAVLLSAGPAISPGELRLSQTADLAADSASVEEQTRALVARALAQGEHNLLDRIVRAAVSAAFQDSDGNQVRAAEKLGITRNEIRTHLARQGVIAPRASRRAPA